MAFLDKINMGARSTETTEQQRVTANLSVVDHQIAQEISKLGQLFYTEHKSDETLDEKYRSIIEDIHKLEENRKGFLEYKLRLEGNFMCANCGQIIPIGSVYCAFCGKRADIKDESAADTEMPKLQSVCQACGFTVEDADAAFCPSCGARMGNG